MVLQEVFNFFIVLACAVGIACVIGTLYAFGLRLWARGSAETEGGAHVVFRIGSALCFALCVAIVLFALWLMIPAFH